MSNIIPEIFGKAVVKDGVVMDTQVSLIPEIFGEPIVDNGVVADVLLSRSDTEKYERLGQLLKEADVKRDEGGRFSTQAASGADEYEDEGEVIETSGAARRKNVEAGITAGEIDAGALLGDETLGIRRADMPQIIEEHTDEFVKELKAMGYDTKLVDVPVGQLQGTQGQLNMDKVTFLLGKMEEGTFDWDIKGEMVLASKDGHILDGHHRWAAQRLFDPNSSMPLLQVDLGIQDLLDEAHAFDDGQYSGVKTEGVASSPEIQRSRAKIEWRGESKGTDTSRTEGPTLEETLRDVLGPDISMKDIPSLIGAPDDVTVTVQVAEGYGGEGFVDMEITSDEMHAIRSFHRSPDGELVLSNDELTVHEQGRGTATKMLSKQVQFCREMGIDKIYTYAAGDSKEQDEAFGYKVWPSLGYDFQDGNRGEDLRNMPKPLRQRLCPERCVGNRYEGSIHEILKTQDGRDWWDDNGGGRRMEFDTREGSLSNKVLDKYLRRKRAADVLPDKYATQDYPDGKPQEGGVEGPDLSPEELEILEEVWEEIEQEMEDGGYTLEDSKDS